MKIPRILTETVISKLKSSDKGIVIYGARQAGKTTLVNDVIKNLGLKTLIVNADQSKYLDIFSQRDLNRIKDFVEGYELLFIDEGQRIPEIGISLKIILDNFPSLKVVVTGSSSLDLASKISEPLTGRIYSYKLFPLAQLELSELQTPYEMNTNLEERLIYGSYPELFSLEGFEAKEKYLSNLTDAYLYKDLLEFGDIRNSTKIRDLLKLLAFQIGT